MPITSHFVHCSRAGVAGAAVRTDEPFIEPLDFAPEPLIPRDHLVGVLAREIEVRVVHLTCERGAFALALFDFRLELSALLRDTRLKPARVALGAAGGVVIS